MATVEPLDLEYRQQVGVTASKAVDAAVGVERSHSGPFHYEFQILGTVRTAGAGLVSHGGLHHVAGQPERSRPAGGIALTRDHPLAGLSCLEGQLGLTENAGHYRLRPSATSEDVTSAGLGNLIEKVLGRRVQLADILHGGLEDFLVLP